jgi:hypothetical protein
MFIVANINGIANGASASVRAVVGTKMDARLPLPLHTHLLPYPRSGLAGPDFTEQHGG